MIGLNNKSWTLECLLITCLVFYGCTVKAVGDPKRPITIEAHITLDIKGLKDTASDIEDFVSGQKPKENPPVKQGG